MTIRRHKRGKRQPGRVVKKPDLINENIQARRVLLIEDGCDPVEMALEEALELAAQRGLDLVPVAKKEVPPCRIADYSKMRYEKEKREKQAAKRQKEKLQELKEIRLLSNIASADLAVKAKAASRFLADNDKVKVSLRVRGRENRKLAIEKIEALKAMVECEFESGPYISEGRFINVVLVPLKKGSSRRKDRAGKKSSV